MQTTIDKNYDKDSMLKKWNASNKGMRAFCVEENIPYFSFQYWHRKLTKGKRNTIPSPANFIKVTPIFPPSVDSNFCELHLASGLKLIFPSQVEASFLKQLL